MTLFRNGKINIPLMYFHRVLRLTPALAATTLFYATLLRYTGSGPIWSVMAFGYECDKTWWATLLYVQNYVYGSELVLPTYIYRSRINFNYIRIN